MVISSRSVDELHALLTPMIEQHGFELDRRHTGTFFDQLRLLSGRLAFKIASTAANQRTEVLGLALARLYLSYQHALDDQVLVPLDSHLELYREARRQRDEVTESTGLQRTDLALFSLDGRRRTVVCRLVEVKCHSGLTGVSDLQRIRERVTRQLNRSAEVLAESFDPDLQSPDRADRVVRNTQLAALLKFYLGRAVRHGVMRPDAAAEADWLLDHLDEGYRWDFTRTGLIFDLSGQGSRQDVDDGIEFHMLGRDVVEDLLEALATDPVLEEGTARPAPAPPHLREGSYPYLSWTAQNFGDPNDPTRSRQMSPGSSCLPMRLPLNPLPDAPPRYSPSRRLACPTLRRARPLPAEVGRNRHQTTCKSRQHRRPGMYQHQCRQRTLPALLTTRKMVVTPFSYEAQMSTWAAPTPHLSSASSAKPSGNVSRWI